MSGRRPGRPAGRSAGDTRARLVEAAREQFAARGFAAASARSIAAAAGVDPSLVNHHFGGKEGLLVATMDLPIDPVEKITGVVAHGVDGLGARLVRTFLETWDPHRDAFSALLRTAMSSPDHAPAVEIARGVLLARLATVTTVDRAALVVAQVVGLATARYVVRIEPVASASVDDLVAVYGPAVQAVVTSAGR